MTTPEPWVAPDLTGRIAVVTGASRGVGRGIALALGSAGATVYVTGRSVRGGTSTEGLPGTIDDTAADVTARGGCGIAVQCDHTDDEQVRRVFAQIEADHGRLDVLVNNAWAGYERGQDAAFDLPFWKQPLWRWDLFAGSVRGHFVASRLAAPLLLESEGGLIANISFADGETPLGQVAYDVSKHSTDRMAVAMAAELRKHGVTAVSLHPGFVRTERVEAAWALLGDGPGRVVHSPEYVGRAVLGVYGDDGRLEKSGRCLAVGDLAAEYGFTDTDGRAPGRFALEGRMTLATRMERLNRVVVKANAQRDAE